MLLYEEENEDKRVYQKIKIMVYKVKTRPNPMKGGVTMCRRAPRA